MAPRTKAARASLEAENLRLEDKLRRVREIAEGWRQRTVYSLAMDVLDVLK